MLNYQDKDKFRRSSFPETFPSKLIFSGLSETFLFSMQPYR